MYTVCPLSFTLAKKVKEIIKPNRKSVFMNQLDDMKVKSYFELSKWLEPELIRPRLVYSE